MSGTVAPLPLALDGVSVIRQQRHLLAGVSWRVEPGQRWVVLGPNGSGKTTILRLASMYLRPSEGTVVVLGETVGRVDVRRHRQRVGLASAALAEQFRANLTPRDVVVCALHAALEPWWHTYSEAELARADDLLAQVGCAELAERDFGTLSSGERQRVQLARTLMTEPGLLLLDEPTAGLDLGGREQLLGTLDRIASAEHAPATVLVTHHLEEIPTSFTHALLLRGGAVVAQGPIEETLDSATVSATFGMAVEVDRRHGRWQAVAVPLAG
ncbi:MAG: ATP-binding cassette domain-containing protein [Acidimicrobiia bacterium]|nr:ATP-binding cassette domain-containing protein [Acidimicrobiia bacterium]